MADIKFLQNIDFTGVTSKNFVVESDGSPSTTGAITGQILFDSGNEKLAYFNGTAWVTVPDTNSNTTYALTAASDNITLTGSNPTSTDNVSLQTDDFTNTSLTSTNNVVTFAGAVPTTTKFGMIKSYSTALTSELNVVSSNTPQTGNDPTRNYQVWIDKNGKALVYVPWSDNNTGMTSWNLSDGGSSVAINDGETATVQAGTSGSLKAALSSQAISLDVEYGTNTADKNVVTAASSTTTVAGTSQLLIENSGDAAGTSVVGRIPWANLKDDVIGGISGAMSFKGAYSNSTAAGSPDIGGGQNNADNTSGTTGTDLEPGDTYVVSAIGTKPRFLNEAIEVGDLIIFSKTTEVTSGSAVSDSDFTIVNRNIDLATESVAGIVSVPTAGGLAIDTTTGASAGQISIAAQTGLPTGSQGDATNVPQITVDGKGIVTALSTVAISIPSAGKTVFGATAGDGTTQLTFKHNLSESNVIVQAWELNEAGTTTLVGANVVYPDIEIKGADEVYLNFAAAATGNKYAVTCTPCPA